MEGGDRRRRRFEFRRRISAAAGAAPRWQPTQWRPARLPIRIPWPRTSCFEGLRAAQTMPPAGGRAGGGACAHPVSDFKARRAPAKAVGLAGPATQTIALLSRPGASRPLVRASRQEMIPGKDRDPSCWCDLKQRRRPGRATARPDRRCCTGGRGARALP